MDKAKEMGEELIKEHCPEYTFKFGHMKTKTGSCHYDNKEIKLSKYFVQQESESNVKNTILHEIAHALTEGHHHNSVWYAKAIELGCSGEKHCYRENPIVKGSRVYSCPNCEKEIRAYRKLKKARACKICCDKHNNGQFSDKFKFVFNRIEN